jgi:sec-independent protein translocase protein TatA
MGSFSLSHWLIVLVVILILFGAGRIPAAMSDLARGVRAFRTGMRDNDEPRSGKLVDAQPAISGGAEASAPRSGLSRGDALINARSGLASVPRPLERRPVAQPPGR